MVIFFFKGCGSFVAVLASCSLRLLICCDFLILLVVSLSGGPCGQHFFSGQVCFRACDESPGFHPKWPVGFCYFIFIFLLL